MHRLTAALLLAAGTYVCPIAASPIALQTGATPLAPPAFEKRQTVRCASTTDCKTVGYHGPSNSHFGCNKKRGLCIWECNAGYQLVGGACEQTCDVTAVCTNDVPVNANRYCRRGLCEWRCRTGFTQSGDLCLAPAASASSSASSLSTLSRTTTRSTTTSAQTPAPTGVQCALTSDCSNNVPLFANRYCAHGTCSWRCRSGYVSNGDGCVSLETSTHLPDGAPTTTTSASPTTATSTPTARACSVVADCNPFAPADAVPICANGRCAWQCEDGFEIGYEGRGCIATVSSASAAPTQPAATPILKRAYQGASFFDGWKFWNDTDPTRGQVVYVDRNYAVEKRLAYVREDGVAVLSIDKSSVLARGEGRASVRISSIEEYEPGSLILVDLAHAPYGPSVWPAFWTYADPWPDLAEIDIYEGINSRTWNQYNIHTTAGCYRNDSVPQTGSRSTSRTHCLANGSGCAVQDYNPESYGKGFNEAGGGVFAVLFAETVISIWRWSRATIPPDVASGEPRWQNWGIPAAAWDGSMCDIKKYFRSQMLTFDITTCGTWAGQTAIWFNSHSSGDTSAYADCVAAVQDPAAFAEAHFEINYVQVYVV